MMQVKKCIYFVETNGNILRNIFCQYIGCHYPTFLCARYTNKFLRSFSISVITIRNESGDVTMANESSLKGIVAGEGTSLLNANELIPYLK